MQHIAQYQSACLYLSIYLSSFAGDVLCGCMSVLCEPGGIAVTAH